MIVGNGNGTYTLTEDKEGGIPRKLVNITTNGATQTYIYTFITRDTLRFDQDLTAD